MSVAEVVLKRLEASGNKPMDEAGHIAVLEDIVLLLANGIDRLDITLEKVNWNRD